MRSSKKWIITFIIVSAVIFLYQCAVNPVTGRKEIMLMSEAHEIKTGAQVHQGILQTYGIYNDPELNKYIARLGQRMAPLTHRPNLKYHFYVLDTPVENAFAAPGGYIYITRGLLAMMNSEAELATIIGHELGHVNARHSARSFTRQILFTLGLVVASELSEDIKKVAPAAMVATQLLFLKYSRSDEYQADSLGVEYARKLSYSPPQMINFFRSIQRLVKIKGGHQIPNFLSTHPLTEKRIERAQGLFIPTDNKLAVKRREFINRTNGLVYGMNPRQGYVEGSRFYHPEMAFSFAIPSKWKVQNTPKQVTLASPKGDAVIMFLARNSSQDLKTHTQSMLKSIANHEVLRESSVRVNRMKAYQSFINYKVESQGQQAGDPNNTMSGQLISIRKGNTIFSFFGTTRSPNYSAYVGDLNHTFHSFAPLKNPKYLNRRPYRVRIQRVPRKMTFQQYLQQQRIPKERWETMGLINSLQLTDMLPPARLIKIIR